MTLAKVARLLCQRIGKQPALCGFGLRLLCHIRPGIAPVAVGPAVPLANHPLTHIGPLPAHTRQNAAIVVAATDLDVDRLVQHKTLQRLTRRWPVGLTNLRGIHAIDSNLDRLTT